MPTVRARSMRLLGGATLFVALVAACSSMSTSPSDDDEATGESSAAVAFPSGNNDGYCASNPSAQCWHGTPVAAKKLVLTFDDGPASQTLVLSSYLKGRGIRATFFVNGKNLGSNAATVLGQLAADGHLIGDHTQDHLDLTSLSDSAIVSQLVATDAIIAPYVASKHFVFRAPFGDWSAHDYSVLHASAMDKYVGPVKWDIGGSMAGGYGADWDCWQNTNGYGVQTTKQCGDRYLREIADVGRGIVLMHDADYGDASNHALSSGKGNTVDMVKYLVEGNAALGVQGLQALAYGFLRLDEIPDIAALFPGGTDAGTGNDTGTGDAGTSDAGSCAFNPTWTQASANEWWIEYAISGTVSSASLEVGGVRTVTLSMNWSKWVASTSRIPTGTQVVVRAKNSAGLTAQTQPFGYLVTTRPVTACAAVDAGTPDTGAPDTGTPDTGTPDTGTPDTGAPDTGAADAGCSSAFVPTFTQGSGADDWWVEYAIANGTPSSAWLEVVGRGNVSLALQWGKWVGLSNASIATGASVIVHAQTAAGLRAQTLPFGYLSVTKPQTASCSN